MQDPAGHQRAPASSAGEREADPPAGLPGAARQLNEVDELALERHPEAFAAIDAQLRRALQTPRDG
jgi:hypothetical protein